MRRRINLRYPDAVRWIARNDEPCEEDEFVLSEFVSVVLIADISGRSPLQVARDVKAARYGDFA